MKTLDFDLIDYLQSEYTQLIVLQKVYDPGLEDIALNLTINAICDILMGLLLPETTISNYSYMTNREGRIRRTRSK